MMSLDQLYLTKKESYWIAQGEKNALELFRAMSKRVPAYKHFLKKHRIDPKKIRTIQDFAHVPPVDKSNYLRQYSLEQLSWDGVFPKGSFTISATSGSTGEPFYFPRTKAQDLQYASVAEAYLRTNFDIQKKSTLYIIGFPMGIWIGGVFTYQALQYVIEKGKYDMSIVTPGIHKEEIIKTVKNLGPHFDQIIIGSYGPFLKDVLDDGVESGLDWKKYNIKFVFSAEGFTEAFRDYVLDKVAAKNRYTSSLNHYGTVDLGTMAYETPLAILARRKALKNQKLYEEFFGTIQRLPTFCQYDPRLFYFEQTKENGLICSARSGIPLVRYDLKDNGGILSYSTFNSICKSNGSDVKREAKRTHIDHTVWELPFVYVYERSDFSVSFHAFQIYPDTIRKALQQKTLISKVTGKFTMLVEFDRAQNQVFVVHIEMKKTTKSSDQLIKSLERVIFNKLIEESSEYRETYRQKGDKILPKVVVWNYEDPRYFKPGTKQKWVSKTSSR